ncbi:hypothetical protein CGRA01v4_14925 [Colletotrichum graminicola]|uniref:BTB domain-containing protein n=1 Tax=Colletotrichum graminicola (strain M1.001 / M2 / FGSC 10212) TaxID=645133 RepID=E3QFJ9_COLGM|nr:uncharacterized protein GLRG_04781 [Colletotrichum graminicola M1.001]EFQ29637.1 hypothetical protein GLRG_04781 [Colletotrichum graminicola M1.001]WDK23633.1 hypothetical protein CGRA01v4_14925 [Colletotrichum graminicola]
METIKMRLPSEASEYCTPEVGPKVSPYASPSCKVYFKGGQPFTVPRDLLCEGLERIRYSSNEIHLGNVPDEVGHAVIHYLHTGRWQTLDDADLPDAARFSKRLEVSLRVYGTAQTYNLPGLAELSKQKMSQYAGALPALQVLVLASDACQLLGEGDPWFPTFIKLRVEELFRDASPQDKTRFLTCFDTATPYSKMLVKLIVEICCNNSAPFYAASQPTPPAEPELLEPFVPQEVCKKCYWNSKKKKMRKQNEHVSKEEVPPEEEVPPMVIAAEPEPMPVPEEYPPSPEPCTPMPEPCTPMPEPEIEPETKEYTLEAEPEPAVETASDPPAAPVEDWLRTIPNPDTKKKKKKKKNKTAPTADDEC